MEWKMSRSRSSSKNEVDDVVTQTLQDVQDLECQIRSLLRSMSVVDKIKVASISSLPERLSPSTSPSNMNDTKQPDTRMQWPVFDEWNKESKTIQDNTVGEQSTLSALDIMEICINEKILKYTLLQESLFFVPVLDRCVFGMTLLNTTSTILKKPKIYLSVVHPSTITEDEHFCKLPVSRNFTYDVKVIVNGGNFQRDLLGTGNNGLDELCPDSYLAFLNHTEEVMPGGKVLVTVTFTYPAENFSSCDFSLLLSVYLDDIQLFVREVPVTSSCFTAASIDNVFKQHHESIISAMCSENEVFSIERLLSPAPPSEMSLSQTIKKFLITLGFQRIGSLRTGCDSIIEAYSTHQPSILWGSCFKIENCERKPSVIRCSISARTKQQMMHIFTQLKYLLTKERQRERNSRLNQIAISPIFLKNNFSVCEQLKMEVDLINELGNVKHKLKKRDSVKSSRKIKMDLCDGSSVDSCWLNEYSVCVEKTDNKFITETQ